MWKVLPFFMIRFSFLSVSITNVYLVSLMTFPCNPVRLELGLCTTSSMLPMYSSAWAFISSSLNFDGTWAKPKLNHLFLGASQVIALKFDDSCFAGSSARKLAFELFREVFDVDLCDIDAFNDRVYFAKLFLDRPDDNPLAFLCDGFTYAKFFRQSARIAYVTHFWAVCILAMVFLSTRIWPGFLGFAPVAT